MELEYNNLSLTDEQKKVLAPLSETDLLYPALPWALSRFYPSEGKLGVAIWSSHEAAGGSSAWFRQAEICEGGEWRVLEALEYLVSVLREVLSELTSKEKAPTGVVELALLQVLRARQTQYFANCKSSPTEPLTSLIEANEDASLRLPGPLEQLVQRMTKKMERRCLN